MGNMLISSGAKSVLSRAAAVLVSIKGKIVMRTSIKRSLAGLFIVDVLVFSATAASAMGGPGCLDRHHWQQPQGYNFSANRYQANTGHPSGHSYRDGQGYGGYGTYDGGYYRGY